MRTSDPVVVLAIVDAVLVGLFFLFRVIPWSRPGPWRLIWFFATLTSSLYILGELAAMLAGGSALDFDHQGPLFGAILAASTSFILVYLHGQRVTERALTLALTDSLTELLNPRAFHARLAVLLERHEPFALVYIDVDGLKRVNDLRGHDRGDELLQSFAKIVRETIRAEDVAARLGGDEFAVLLPGADEATARSVAERVLAEFRERTARLVGTLQVGASAGIATSADGATAAQLLNAADGAMYRAKAAGGNRVTLAHGS